MVVFSLQYAHCCGNIDIFAVREPCIKNSVRCLAVLVPHALSRLYVVYARFPVAPEHCNAGHLSRLGSNVNSPGG